MHYKVKKKFAFLIIGILLFQAIIPTSIGAEGSEEVDTREITNNVLSEKNTNFEGYDAEKDDLYWWYGSGAVI